MNVPWKSGTVLVHCSWFPDADRHKNHTSYTHLKQPLLILTDHKQKIHQAVRFPYFRMLPEIPGRQPEKWFFDLRLYNFVYALLSALSCFTSLKDQTGENVLNFVNLPGVFGLPVFLSVFVFPCGYISPDFVSPVSKQGIRSLKWSKMQIWAF